METAKVDIRKLQLLNDRINQCIDALNQVRLSVHGLSQGLSHSNPQNQAGVNPGSQYGQGFSGFGVNPFNQPGVNPFGFGDAAGPGDAGLRARSLAHDRPVAVRASRQSVPVRPEP